MTSPLTTMERIAWLSTHCPEFILEIKQDNFRLWASLCRGDDYYGAAGSVSEHMAEEIDCAFYDLLEALHRQPL